MALVVSNCPLQIEPILAERKLTVKVGFSMLMVDVDVVVVDVDDEAASPRASSISSAKATLLKPISATENRPKATFLEKRMVYERNESFVK